MAAWESGGSRASKVSSGLRRSLLRQPGLAAGGYDIEVVHARDVFAGAAAYVVFRAVLRLDEVVAPLATMASLPASP